MQNQKNPWYISTVPLYNKNVHLCAYDTCPGLKRNNKRKRGYITTMKCEECLVLNKNMYFCMKIADKKVQNCHNKYHIIKFPNTNIKS